MNNCIHCGGLSEKPCEFCSPKTEPPAPTAEQVREARGILLQWCNGARIEVPFMDAHIRALLAALDRAQGLAEFYKSGLAVKREELSLMVESETALRAENAAQAEEIARLTKALERLAQPMDCGCNPCRGQCTSKESLELELKGLRDFAQAALKPSTK